MCFDTHMRTYALAAAPAEIQDAVRGYERVHGADFVTATVFGAPLLRSMHQVPGSREATPPIVRVARPDDRSAVDAAMATLTTVANDSTKSEQARRAYLAALLDLFNVVPVDLLESVRRPDTVCVAPEREGQQLASMLGALPVGRNLTPNAKRIPAQDGLLVTTTQLSAPPGAQCCVLVDGVIATGATLICLIDQLRGSIRRFEIVCAHSTAAGLWGLHRYAAAVGIDLDVRVAAVSGSLNSKYYAVDPEDPDILVLGDIGDTITGIATA